MHLISLSACILSTVICLGGAFLDELFDDF